MDINLKIPMEIKICLRPNIKLLGIRKNGKIRKK